MVALADPNSSTRSARSWTHRTAAIGTNPHQKADEMEEVERETGLEPVTFSLEGLRA
jgi:hypothetical protein